MQREQEGLVNDNYLVGLIKSRRKGPPPLLCCDMVASLFHLLSRTPAYWLPPLQPHDWFKSYGNVKYGLKRVDFS